MPLPLSRPILRQNAIETSRTRIPDVVPVGKVREVQRDILPGDSLDPVAEVAEILPEAAGCSATRAEEGEDHKDGSDEKKGGLSEL